MDYHRIAQLIARLDCENEHEVLAAVRGLRLALARSGHDLRDFAQTIEQLARQATPLLDALSAEALERRRAYGFPEFAGDTLSVRSHDDTEHRP